MKIQTLIALFVSLFLTMNSFCQDDAQIKLDNMKYYLSVIKEYSQSMRYYADSVKIIELLDQMDQITISLEDEVNKIVVPEMSEENPENTVNSEDQSNDAQNNENIESTATEKSENDDQVFESSNSSFSKMLPFKNKFNTSIKFQFGINALISSNENKPGILYPEINTGGSWYWDIALVRKARLGGKDSRVALNYGIGYLRNKYKIENDLRLVHNNQNRPEFVSMPEVKDNPSINTGHINLPLSLTFALSKKVKFEAGGYVGYRVRTSQYIELKNNKEIISEHRRSGYNLSNWLFGTQFSLDVSGFDLIFRYNMSKFFKDNSVYDFNSWMLGTSFSLF